MTYFLYQSVHSAQVPSLSILSTLPATPRHNVSALHHLYIEVESKMATCDSDLRAAAIPVPQPIGRVGSRYQPSHKIIKIGKAH